MIHLFEVIFGQKFDESPGLRKAFRNFLWLFLDKGICLGGGFIIMICLARYLGPAQFGVLNYAVSFVLMFAVLGSLGLNEIIIRDIIKEPSKTKEILGSAFVLKMAANSLSFLSILGVSYVVNLPDNVNHWFVCILAISVLFQSFEVIDMYFLSQVASRYAVSARVTTFIVFTGIKICLIVQHAALLVFAWVLMLEIVAGWLLLLGVYEWRTRALRSWCMSYACVKQLFLNGLPVFISAIAWMVFTKIDQIFLKFYAGNAAVGVYAAACRVAEIGFTVNNILLFSIFPVIMELKRTDPGLYHQKVRKTFDLLMVLALFLSILVFLFAGPIIIFLYGPAYQPAVPLLKVYIFTTVFFFFCSATNYFLIAESCLTHYVFRMVVMCVVGIALDLLLIPRWGAIGAATASLIGMSIPLLMWPLALKKLGARVTCRSKGEAL